MSLLLATAWLIKVAAVFLASSLPRRVPALREGSGGAVVNQGRQQRRPGIPRMRVLLGAVGFFSDQSSN